MWGTVSRESDISRNILASCKSRDNQQDSNASSISQGNAVFAVKVATAEETKKTKEIETDAADTKIRRTAVGRTH